MGQEKLVAYGSEEYASNKAKFEKSLEQLARGVSSIDESLATPNYWDDVSQNLNKGLKDITSNIHLRDNFEEFLVRVLDYKKGCFCKKK